MLKSAPTSTWGQATKVSDTWDKLGLDSLQLGYEDRDVPNSTHACVLNFGISYDKYPFEMYSIRGLSGLIDSRRRQLHGGWRVGSLTCDRLITVVS